MPNTITALYISSMPPEVEATPELSFQSFSTQASDSCERCTLAQRIGHAQGGGAARIAHRLVIVVGHHLGAAGGCLADALGGEQGHLTWTKCTSSGIGDTGVAHRFHHRLRGGLDLRHAPEFFRQKLAGEGDAGGQAFWPCAPGRR